MERAGERNHSEEGDQAQHGQARERNRKWQQWEPVHGTSPGYRPQQPAYSDPPAGQRPLLGAAAPPLMRALGPAWGVDEGARRRAGALATTRHDPFIPGSFYSLSRTIGP